MASRLMPGNAIIWEGKCRQHCEEVSQTLCSTLNCATYPTPNAVLSNPAISPGNSRVNLPACNPSITQAKSFNLNSANSILWPKISDSKFIIIMSFNPFESSSKIISRSAGHCYKLIIDGSFPVTFATYTSSAPLPSLYFNSKHSHVMSRGRLTSICSCRCQCRTKDRKHDYSDIKY